MAWLLIRTFLVAPVIFLVAALIFAAVMFHAALENRARPGQGSRDRSERGGPTVSRVNSVWGASE